MQQCQIGIESFKQFYCAASCVVEVLCCVLHSGNLASEFTGQRGFSRRLGGMIGWSQACYSEHGFATRSKSSRGSIYSFTDLMRIHNSEAGKSKWQDGMRDVMPALSPVMSVTSTCQHRPGPPYGCSVTVLTRNFVPFAIFAAGIQVHWGGFRPLNL